MNNKSKPPYYLLVMFVVISIWGASLSTWIPIIVSVIEAFLLGYAFYVLDKLAGP